MKENRKLCDINFAELGTHGVIDDLFPDNCTGDLGRLPLVMIAQPDQPAYKWNAGLQITAGQRTMSGQKEVLSGQILRWPDNLSGHLH